MENEVIEKIKDAEVRAREITADAARHAAAFVTAAREDAQTQARQIALDADAENKKIFDIRIDSSHEEARGQAKRMVAAADENMKAAVNEIIREIFKKWQ